MSDFTTTVLLHDGPLTIVRFPSKLSWKRDVLPAFTRLMRTFDLRQKDIRGFETLDPSPELDLAFEGKPTTSSNFLT